MLIAGAPQVKELAEWTADWCVSAFLTAHEVAGKKVGDSLRLKNLLRDAENELLNLGVRRSEVGRLLEEAIPEEIHDPEAEVFHRAGVAIFCAPGLVRSYHLTHESPTLVTVATRFHLKPLLLELAHERRFFVLGLTRGSAQLFEGGPRELKGVEVPGMPGSIEEAVQYDDRERALLSHSASRSGVGGVVAAFHGQGARGDHLQEDLRRYLRSVDASLSGVVEPTTPVVLAGSRDTVAAYRELSSHRTLAEKDIFGNPQIMKSSELHSLAWAIVDAAPSGFEDDAARFAQFDGTGKASTMPAVVFAAARRGRVATIFVASDLHCWGRFDRGADAPDLHDVRTPGDEDLLDTAAVDAWETGGTVHVAPASAVPGGGVIAALLRY